MPLTMRSAPTSAGFGSRIGIKSNGTIRLKHTTVEYGTYGISCSANQDTDEIVIEDSIIRYTSGNGIYVYADSNADISVFINNNTITDNNGRGIFCRAYNGSTTINTTVCGNTISENGDIGIYYFADGGSGDPTITGSICNNTIYRHDTYGIYAYAYQGGKSDLIIRKTETASLFQNPLAGRIPFNIKGIQFFRNNGMVGVCWCKMSINSGETLQKEKQERAQQRSE